MQENKSLNGKKYYFYISLVFCCPSVSNIWYCYTHLYTHIINNLLHGWFVNTIFIIHSLWRIAKLARSLRSLVRLAILHNLWINKTPAKAFSPPADEKKMGTIWIFVYYAVYGSGRGRDFLVLKWGGGLNLQIWDLNRPHETERIVFPILQVFSMCRCKLWHKRKRKGYSTNSAMNTLWTQNTFTINKTCWQ